MPNIVINAATAQAPVVTTIGAPTTAFGMTLADYRSEVIADLQGRVDITAGGNTRLDRWLNWGYVSIAQMLDLSELWASFPLNTVAGQPFYLLEQAVGWIKSVNYDRLTSDMPDGELAQIDQPTWRTLPDSDDFSIPSPRIPTSWFRWGRILVLWPTPDNVYSLAIDCRVRPLNLVSTTDCTILPPEFNEATVYAGLERAWRSLRNPAASAEAMNNKLAVIRPILNTDAEERSSMHMGFAPARSRADLYRGQI